jgi:hypothetical protein
MTASGLQHPDEEIRQGRDSSAAIAFIKISHQVPRRCVYLQKTARVLLDAASGMSLRIKWQRLSASLLA